MAGATPVAALDMWGPATDTYGLNFPGATIYNAEVSSISPQRVIDDVGGIDLLLASPECTSHSVARGSKPGCEKSRETAFEVIRYAEILRPRWVVVENVIQMRGWFRFKEWHKRLESLGYHLNSGILDSQFFGTPQSRRRFFIVGDLESSPSLPSQSKRTRLTVNSILGRGESKERPWKFSPLMKTGRARSTIERAEGAIDALGKGVPFIMVYYGTDGSGGFQGLNRPLRTVTTVDRFGYVRPNVDGYEMRMLQPPELAAAMGFPSGHKFLASSRRTKNKLIGNAVCPRVMESIVKLLITP